MGGTRFHLLLSALRCKQIPVRRFLHLTILCSPDWQNLRNLPGYLQMQLRPGLFSPHMPDISPHLLYNFRMSCLLLLLPAVIPGSYRLFLLPYAQNLRLPYCKVRDLPPLSDASSVSSHLPETLQHNPGSCKMTLLLPGQVHVLYCNNWLSVRIRMPCDNRLF